MKRPEQHITETKSKRIFERIIPVEWVARELSSDYGVDFLIEVFENNESTGKTFFVQLKGSTQNIENETFKKQISIDNLNYYNSLSLPVMIICVAVDTEEIWGIWANNLIEIKELKEGQQDLSITLSKEYKLNEKRLSNIVTDLNASQSIGFSIISNSVVTGQLKTHISQHIKHYYPENIKINASNLPKHIKSTFNSNSENEISVDIKASGFHKKIKIPKLTQDELFLNRPLYDQNEINKFNFEILLSIAMLTAKYDIKGTLRLLKKIVEKIEFKDQEQWNTFDPLGLLALAKNNDAILLHNEFVQELIKTKQEELFLFVDMSYFVLSDEEIDKLRIKNLLLAIENSDDPKLKGTCHYNIGNIIRPNSNNAIAHYFKAAKLFSDYKKRPYFWRELAGLLFSKRHFSWAEDCYKKSIMLSQTETEEKEYIRLEKNSPRAKYIVTALIGDCLFMQSKYKEAIKLFQDYLQASKIPSHEWLLKIRVCHELVKNGLDNTKIDYKESDRLCKKASQQANNDKAIELLSKAAELNPINTLAWFNLGVALDKAGRFDESLFAFLLTGLIQDGDKEAQFNALLIAFTQNKDLMLQSILTYIYEKHGPTVINDISDYIMKKSQPLEAKQMLINGLKDMIKIIETEHNNMYDSISTPTS